jgi:drug/metabolite transporter (DMT)-like permease
MLVWFLLAIGSAITNSWTQAMQKWAVSLSRYSKISISFIALATSSLILFLVSYFFTGFPDIDGRFWGAVAITGILNIITFPLMLRAYEIGEFSSVYSMILLTPVFLLLTSFIFLGEAVSLLGGAGVALTVLGLWVTTRSNHEHAKVPDFAKGNLLGILVAFLWSISTNFDKLATVYSNQVFAPAVASAIMAGGYAVYLLVKHRTVLVRAAAESPNNHRFLGAGFAILLLLGLTMALSNVLHNSALLAGFVTYTIAVKRTGVLFGVFWGWLFFHEKNIASKLFGVIIAILGVVAILFS